MDITKSAHTPGPWAIEGDADADECSIVNREHPGMDWDVCTVHSSAANARLIAAAPDLLAVLQEVRERPLITEYTDWWLRVEAAVRKATGEAK